mmetsp:Transcript_6490/g.585  ORF Transcript_6490/g.585 Transcript_6490/m.585 type:complete len:99 (+) Transcript_6490:132-428(+)
MDKFNKTVIFKLIINLISVKKLKMYNHYKENPMFKVVINNLFTNKTYYNLLLIIMKINNNIQPKKDILPIKVNLLLMNKMILIISIKITLNHLIYKNL